MSDITKCTGDNCPMKETCRRFTDISDGFRQSWFVDVPLEEDEHSISCEMYWGKSPDDIFNFIKKK